MTAASAGSEEHSLASKYRAVSLGDADGAGCQIVTDADPVGYELSITQNPRVPATAGLLARLVRGGTLFDIGANIGTICVPCACRGASVVAVEMLAENCAKLAEAVRLNGLARFEIVQAAATDQDGFVGYDGDHAAGRIIAAADAPQARALTVDTIAHTIRQQRPGFLDGPITFKIDVECHEPEVLRGAENTINAFRPVILFESIETTEQDGSEKRAKRFLADRGYELFLVTGKNIIPRQRDAPQELLVADFLAVPKEKRTQTMAALAGYAIRDLTPIELGVWLADLTSDSYPPVRDHARNALKRAPAAAKLACYLKLMSRRFMAR